MSVCPISALFNIYVILVYFDFPWCLQNNNMKVEREAKKDSQRKTN